MTRDECRVLHVTELSPRPQRQRLQSAVSRGLALTFRIERKQPGKNFND